MASEESPLLGESIDADVLKHEQVYNRFKPSQKRMITALISLAGLLPCELLPGYWQRRSLLIRLQCSAREPSYRRFPK